MEWNQPRKNTNGRSDFTRAILSALREVVIPNGPEPPAVRFFNKETNANADWKLSRGRFTESNSFTQYERIQQCSFYRAARANGF